MSAPVRVQNDSPYNGPSAVGLPRPTLLSHGWSHPAGVPEDRGVLLASTWRGWWGCVPLATMEQSVEMVPMREMASLPTQNLGKEHDFFS